MSADTPALPPGAAPDPSAASALDALLRYAEADFHPAPRLAAIVRVLVEALGDILDEKGPDSDDPHNGGQHVDCSECAIVHFADEALARAEAIAKGEA